MSLEYADHLARGRVPDTDDAVVDAGGGEEPAVQRHGHAAQLALAGRERAADKRQFRLGIVDINHAVLNGDGGDAAIRRGNDVEVALLLERPRSRARQLVGEMVEPAVRTHDDLTVGTDRQVLDPA